MSIEIKTENKVTSAVRLLSAPDEGAWDSFVSDNQETNLYHSLLWRDFVCEVFNGHPKYLIAENSGNICGILPIFLFKNPIFGSKLISMPYDIGSGGTYAADSQSVHALIRQAVSLAKELRVNYIELRYGQARKELETYGFQRSEPVLISEMDLDSKENVWQRIQKNHRKDIRQAANRGVEIHIANNLADYQAFYDVYLRVFRNFGTPPYGATYFTTLWRRLAGSGAARLLIAKVEEQTVGGLLLFCSGHNMVSKLAACLPIAVPMRAYSALYWRAIELGLELGYRKLSWGTSSRAQTGLIEFKKRWGAATRPAVFYTMPIKRTAPAIEKYYDSGTLVRRLWRVQPLWTSRIMGASLNRWFC